MALCVVPFHTSNARGALGIFSDLCEAQPYAFMVWKIGVLRLYVDSLGSS